MQRPKSILYRDIVILSEKDREIGSTIVVRVLIQLSAMLSDVDELTETQFSKHRLKKELNVFLKSVDVSIDKHMNHIVSASPDTYSDAQTDVHKHLQGFFLVDSEISTLLKVYVQAQSIVMDLKSLDPEYTKLSELAQTMNVRVPALLNTIKNQYNNILSQTNKDGETVDVLVDAYNEYVRSVIN